MVQVQVVLIPEPGSEVASFARWVPARALPRRSTLTNRVSHRGLLSGLARSFKTRFHIETVSPAKLESRISLLGGKRT